MWPIADPIQDLEYCGGAEEKKISNMLLTSEQRNKASGAVDPIYLSEAYLYRENRRELDHDQDGMIPHENRGPENIQFYFSERRLEML